MQEEVRNLRQNRSSALCHDSTRSRGGEKKSVHMEGGEIDSVMERILCFAGIGNSFVDRVGRGPSAPDFSEGFQAHRAKYPSRNRAEYRSSDRQS